MHGINQVRPSGSVLPAGPAASRCQLGRAQPTAETPFGQSCHLTVLLSRDNHRLVSRPGLEPVLRRVAG